MTAAEFIELPGFVSLSKVIGIGYARWSAKAFVHVDDVSFLCVSAGTLEDALRTWADLAQRKRNGEVIG